MQTDTLRVAVLPGLGGKIASLRWLSGGLELLQQPLAPYAPRTMSMGFDESDASGFDECLPSVAACEVPLDGRRVQVPDHGDFWRLVWDFEQNGNEIRLTATGASLPLRFERVLKLEGSTLEIRYRVTNLASEAVEYGWAAHPLFAVDRGDRVVLPEEVGSVQVEGSRGERLGAKGARHAWPRTRTAAGEEVDLSVAGGPEDGAGDKLFALAPAAGWAAIERRRAGVRVEFGFDGRKTPWLGLWLCYGGWPEGKESRQQCVAIEPCTAPMDSLAEAVNAGAGCRLEAGESDEWPMRIQISRLG